MRAFPILWGSSLYSAFALGLWARRAPSRDRLALYGVLVWLSMVGQILLMASSDLLSVKTALPLHLCSFSGALSLPAMLSGRRGASRFLNRLGRIGAALALIFPAPLQTRFPLWSDGLFYLTHALLLFAPIGEKPGGARGAALLAAVLALSACAADSLWGANYLFLNRFPAGTPLDFLNGQPLWARTGWILGAMLLILIPDKKGGRKHK